MTSSDVRFIIKHDVRFQSYNLKAYFSKYPDSVCCICRKKMEIGVPILQIPYPIRMRLYQLGITKTKTFKYAHTSCFPALLGRRETEIIKQVVLELAEVTDPNWPKDAVGFNKADGGLVNRWASSNFDELGTYNILQCLQHYFNTQIESEKVSELQGFIKSAHRIEIEEVSVNKPKMQPIKTNKENGSPLDRESGDVLIAAIKIPSGYMLVVYIDPPWENPKHAEIKTRLKGDPVRAKYDPEKKAWLVQTAILLEHMDSLFQGETVRYTQGAKTVIDEALNRRDTSSALEVNEEEDIVQNIQDVIPEGLQLWPFQQAGVKFLELAKGRALIGDEMGCGKTVQALAWLALHPEVRPVLIIVPAVVSYNWMREAEKWIPGSKIHRIKSSKSKIQMKDKSQPDICVATYDIVRRRSQELSRYGFKAVVADECHALKNHKTGRTRSVTDIIQGQDIESVIALSGTPILNRPVEFYTILNLLQPMQWGTWWNYTQRYCAGHKGKFGYICDGVSNTQELRAKLRDVMVRRLKKDVLSELPDKMRVSTEVVLTKAQEQEYRMAIASAVQAAKKAKIEKLIAGGATPSQVEEVEQTEGETALVEITAARRALGKIKAKAALEWIYEYINQEQPIVVFGHHLDVLDEIEEALKEKDIKVGRIDGGISQLAREETVKNFQNGNLNVILVSVMAGGVGITLTRASHALVIERSWTPALEEQAEDRLHRIGQDSAVTIRYLLARFEKGQFETVDQMMDTLINEKREVLHSVLVDIRKDLTEAWKKQRTR